MLRLQTGTYGILIDLCSLCVMAWVKWDGIFLLLLFIPFESGAFSVDLLLSVNRYSFM